MIVFITAKVEMDGNLEYVKKKDVDKICTDGGIE